MNVPAIAVVLLALAQSDTTALVEAAKDAKAKRKGSTTKVITNADVKKADKSKVSQRPGDAEPVAPQPTLIEKQAAERSARIESEEKLKTLNASIATLETELAKLEQSYYETNDLDYRDTELVKRFNEVKKKLDELRRTAAVPAAENAASRRPAVQDQ